MSLHKNSFPRIPVRAIELVNSPAAVQQMHKHKEKNQKKRDLGFEQELQPLPVPEVVEESRCLTGAQKTTPGALVAK